MIAIAGDLGSGKTHFVRGVTAGLGSPDQVTSPTFTLVHEYNGGPVPVYHFDFFRIETVAAANRLDLEEYFYGEGVCLIEWADKFPVVIPEHASWVALRSKGEQSREITM